MEQVGIDAAGGSAKSLRLGCRLSFGCFGAERWLSGQFGPDLRRGSAMKEWRGSASGAVGGPILRLRRPCLALELWFR